MPPANRCHNSAAPHSHARVRALFAHINLPFTWCCYYSESRELAHRGMPSAYPRAAAATSSIALRGTISARGHRSRRALDGAEATPFPGLRCRSTSAGNPARGSTHRDSLCQGCYLLRSITSAQRRMILVTRHKGALKLMLLQVAFALPKIAAPRSPCKSSYARCPQQPTPALLSLGLHMGICCPLRTR